MSEHQESEQTEHGAHDHHGPSMAVYMAIFAALCFFTAASFFANWLVAAEVLSVGASVAIIIGVAIIKATLVGMFFMHLKFDWGNLYYLVIPVLILTFMMVIVLLPDVVFAWNENDYFNKLYHPE